jgi:hypothetical protein
MIRVVFVITVGSFVVIIEKVDEMQYTVRVDWWRVPVVSRRVVPIDNQRVSMLAIARISNTCNAMQNATMQWWWWWLLLLFSFPIHFHFHFRCWWWWWWWCRSFVRSFRSVDRLDFFCVQMLCIVALAATIYQSIRIRYAYHSLSLRRLRSLGMISACAVMIQD